MGCALGDLYIRRDSSNARLEFKQGLINERIYDTFLLSLRYIVALLQGFQVRILKRREKATLQFALRLYHLLSLMSFINSFIRMGVRSYLKPSALFLHPGPLRTVFGHCCRCLDWPLRVLYRIRYKPNIIRYKTRYIHPRRRYEVVGRFCRFCTRFFLYVFSIYGCFLYKKIYSYCFFLFLFFHFFIYKKIKK